MHSSYRNPRQNTCGYQFGCGTQLTRNRQPFSRCQASLLKETLQMDFATVAGDRWISEGFDVTKNSITAQNLSQSIWLHKGIELVPGVGESFRRQGHAHRGQSARASASSKALRIRPAVHSGRHQSWMRPMVLCRSVRRKLEPKRSCRQRWPGYARVQRPPHE